IAEDLFGHGVRVDIGGVEGRDACVECGMHALLGRVVLHLRAVREPIAVGDLGDLESAVSQISVLHDLSLRPSRLLWNPRSESGRNPREVVSPGRNPAIPGSPSGTPEPAGA